MACRNGWYDVVKVLVEEYHCDPNFPNGVYAAARLLSTHLIWKSALKPADFDESEIPSHLRPLDVDVDAETLLKNTSPPLHYACAAGHLDVVKFLIEHGCDPASISNLGATPLSIACENGHQDIVKCLVTEHHCDPLKPSRKYGINSGITPLHEACFAGHYEVVAFLLSSGKADDLMSCKPGRLVSKENREALSSWGGMKNVFTSFLDCRRNNPFHPAFKIFVMGNPEAGKSTLVKAIQTKITDKSWMGWLTRRRVSGVELHTAGIIPVYVENEKLGSIIMYDMAGQYQYYSSHAALLEKLLSSPGTLLVVVVDLSKSTEEITQRLQYWNSFIQNICCRNGNPNIIIIGSHTDIVKSQKESLTVTQKTTEIAKTLKFVQKHEIIPLDCTQLASDGLTTMCDRIAKCCTEFQQNIDIDLQVHFLYAFLARKFKGKIAYRVSVIMHHILTDETVVVKVKRTGTTYSILPRDLPTLSQHLSTLNEKGHFLYLKNEQYLEDSWVIQDQDVLLSEVNGTIFAPENFKQHHDISNSTGVVPFSKIAAAFPRHNPKMIISFLSHLEFCQQIAESEASAISGCQLGSSQQPKETFYFFPSLVSEERPEESCELEQIDYRCGWSLQCIRSDQHLSSRFLHVLLLRLAFSFAMAPETTKVAKENPVLQRQCNVWKAGIHWQNRDGVETTVEVLEQNRVLTLMMGCLEGNKVECIRLRSELIRTILDVKDTFCGVVALRESFIDPSELVSYPLRSPKLLLSFTITELATAIAENKQVVTCKHGHDQKMLAINKLLFFEPYACFNRTLLAEIFKNEKSDKEVPDTFFLDAGKVAHSKMDILKKILDHIPSELQVAIAIANASETYKDDPMHQCYLLFCKWAFCSHSPTYQALKSALDRFSVFCGRNPLVSIVCVFSCFIITHVPISYYSYCLANPTCALLLHFLPVPHSYLQSLKER